MKRSMVILWIVGIGMCSCLWSPLVRAEIIDKIVAILEEELILLSELRECISKPVIKVVANLGDSVNIEQDALRYMIERRLLLREVQYLAFPEEKDLDRSLATQYIINAYYHKDAQAFAAKVQVQGVTDAELEQELALYVKGIDYIRRKSRFNADIDNPDVVLNLFQKWIEDLQARAKIQTSF